jgi:hypothetical protein
VDASSVDQLQSQVASFSKELGDQLSGAQGNELILGQALIAFSDPTHQTELQTSDGRKLPFRNWATQPDLGDFLRNAQVSRIRPTWYFDLSDDATPLDADVAGMGGATPRAAAAHVSNAGAATLAHPALVRLPMSNVSASRAMSFSDLQRSTTSTREVMALDKNVVRVSVTLQALASIRVEAGGWLLPEAIKRFAQGPFLPKGPFGPSSGNRFWGPKGVFPYLPVDLQVAYRPTVTVDAGSEAWSLARTQWEGGKGIEVGAMAFSPQQEDVATFDSKSLSFKVVSQSPYPVLLAVENTVLPRL